ncbi:MAG: hypothetical protein O2962_07845, partial [Cyanobacteria bacterium]|nr:hypothetical protein [Cyanobacteriota bacterium]
MSAVNQIFNGQTVTAQSNQEPSFTASGDFAPTALPTQAPVAQQLAQPVANIEQVLAKYLTSLQAIQPESSEANDPMAFIQNLIAQSPLAGLFGATNNSEPSSAMKAALEQLPQLEQAVTAKITSLLANPEFINYASKADSQGVQDADPVVAATVAAVKSLAGSTDNNAIVKQALNSFLTKAIGAELAQAHQQVVNAQAANDPQSPEALFGTVMRELAPAFGEVMQVEETAQATRLKTLPRLLTSFGNALLNAAKALQAQLAPEAT